MALLSHRDEPEAPPRTYVVGSPPVWAGAVIVLAGLGVSVIGGCFLIGVAELVSRNFTASANQPASLSPDESFLLVVLYALAFLHLVAGAVVVCIALWGLLRILFGRVGSKS